MMRAQLPWFTGQLLRCLLRFLALVCIRLAQVLQGETRNGIIHTLSSAQRTVTVSSLSTPVLLQAGCTEAVAALQDHWVSEDFAAHGTSEVQLREIGLPCHPEALLLFYPETESKGEFKQLIKHRGSHSLFIP